MTTGGLALFGRAPADDGKVTFANMAFGERHPALGRYKLPLLPGEVGTKTGGDWVPRGIQSATNLAGSISETRALGIWERQRSQLGLALDGRLYERMAYLIRTALADGLDLNEKLSASELGKRVAAELDLLHNEARERCGANMAATRGTALHDGWEHRAPYEFAPGEPLDPEIHPGITIEPGSALFSDVPGEGAMFVALESLLKRAGLERVPGMQERVVRHVELSAAGRFDDVLRTTRDIEWEQRFGDSHVLTRVIPAGTMLMSDLKTKRDRFWSWLEVRIQLAVYATAEWLLANDAGNPNGACYVPGPKHHVSQEWGVVLHMPQDGAPPALKRVNIQAGLRAARLARAVCDERSEGKSVATHGEANWPEQL